MSAFAVYLQPAFILHQRSYRETSVFIELFTRDYGIISVLAKGVRKPKSKFAGVLMPFSLLNISFLDKHEVKLLTDVELACRYELRQLSLYCGFYLNELLQKLLYPHDPYPEVFINYRNCIDHLTGNNAVEEILRYFELDLLEALGYGMLPEAAVSSSQASERYRFHGDQGLIQDAQGCISMQTLRALNNRQALSLVQLQETKTLCRQVLDYYLLGKQLKSREVLAQMIKFM
ncbi:MULTISPECIES: DNA repair protein RecO [Methylomonas]|uniref:DNA repair protein RecO n=1 Tax=Methylomonas TaxID=416 RepID=UPI001232F2F5|nr:DNA repair protein RecO [Methylomonas rhizoryzae]